mmetsp:Transcript_30965/g.52285  ORF Transcript_30965/g.52285 Transcript_30965/m.52285 type:complete len:152 (+) Transcript_30965:1930-2385(+)
MPFADKDNATKGQATHRRGRNSKVLPYDKASDIPAVTLDATADGQLVTVVPRPRTSVLTVTTLQIVLEKEKSSVSMRGKLLLDWWEFMKTQHTILSVIYTKSTDFTRPERIMTIAVFFLSTMAVNCFLFIFAGNASSGENFAEIFIDNTTY